MVIVADNAPAAEACICKPCSVGHAQERIKFGSCKHNPAWSLSVAQLVVELIISRKANDKIMLLFSCHDRFYFCKEGDSSSTARFEHCSDCNPS